MKNRTARNRDDPSFERADERDGSASSRYNPRGLLPDSTARGDDRVRTVAEFKIEYLRYIDS
jgi:hypothetical protein